MDTLCLNLNIEDFTVDRWTLIVKYKTAFYSFYCSVAIGMIVFGIDDQKAYDNAREILMVMGIYFQAQDDYLDAYATKEVLGKVGTDIQDKKCGWLFCKAYCELPITAEQRKLLKVPPHTRRPTVPRIGLSNCVRCASRRQDNYGYWDDEKVARVKALYKELDLEKHYFAYEEDSYKQIMGLKPTVEGILPWSIFEIFLSKVYKRKM